MSQGLICDNCGAALPVNHHGESDDGEDAAWIKVTIAGQALDACTRSCAHEILDDEAVVEAHNAHLESIAGVVRDIRDAG